MKKVPAEAGPWARIEAELAMEASLQLAAMDSVALLGCLQRIDVARDVLAVAQAVALLARGLRR